MNGFFYGMTAGEGCGYSCGPGGRGTVYRFDAVGNKTVIYSFGNAPDAYDPTASLVSLNGGFYGDTQTGGAYSNGTVFGVTPLGTERVLYSFKGGSDGAVPQSGLIAAGGELYGTTVDGGYEGSGCFSGCGTVFKMSPLGEETVLYRFAGPPHDGAHPAAPLTYANGTLYGTTWTGGNQKCGGAGCGTAFSLSPSGKERVLHRFTGAPEGENLGSLILYRGMFYGTTVLGGTHNKCGGNYGCGMFFSMSPSGKLHVLYSFKGDTDAETPSVTLLRIGHGFYGTGGGGLICSGYRCGTVFEVSTSGSERVLYSFKGQPDGKFPGWPLVARNGLLYGTTVEGGAYDFGSIFTLPIP
jgi:uncharacterized repeat protein (TIGR03803 family)